MGNRWQACGVWQPNYGQHGVLRAVAQTQCAQVDAEGVPYQKGAPLPLVDADSGLVLRVTGARASEHSAPHIVCCMCNRRTVVEVRVARIAEWRERRAGGWHTQ